MKIKLLTNKKYPASWVFNAPAYKAGEIVEAVEAKNLPYGGYWIDTPELKDDCYGIHVDKEDCEVVETR